MVTLHVCVVTEAGEKAAKHFYFMINNFLYFVAKGIF